MDKGDNADSSVAANAVAEAVAAAHNTAQTAEQCWSNHYGALILFFEENGHTNLPNEHTIYPWVTEQRSRYKELSELQRRQLSILNFWFVGRAHSPASIGRCAHPTGCKKYAAFHVYCHSHFSGDPSLVSGIGESNKKPKSKKVTKPRTAPKQGDFPLIGLLKRKSGKYDIESKNEKVKELTRDEVIDRLKVFIHKISQHNCGNSRDNRFGTACTCMQYLGNKPFIVESVSHAILNYYEMTPLQRKHYSVERMRYAEMAKREKPGNKVQRIYALPLCYKYFEEEQQQQQLSDGMDEEDGQECDEGHKENSKQAEGSEEVNVDANKTSNKQQQMMMISDAFKQKICLHAFHNLHHIGTSQRQTLDKYANGDLSVGTHGNAGKKWNGNKKYIAAYESCRDLLNALTEEYRDIEEPNGDITLPLVVSKRKTYESWIAMMGYVPQKYDVSLGQYSKPEDWPLQPGYYKMEEEAVMNGGKVAKAIFSWTVFARFWREQFPHLKTQGRVGKGLHGGKYDFETKKYYT